MVSGRLADRQAVVGRREEGGSGERVRGEGECGRGGGAWSNVGWVSRAGGVFAAVMDDGLRLGRWGESWALPASLFCWKSLLCCCWEALEIQNRYRTMQNTVQSHM